jgi:hypothetical protein
MTAITCAADLKALPIWISYNLVPQPDGKKARKEPYTPGTSRKARVNDRATWRTHAEALADHERTGRIPGCILTPEMNVTLIDIDGQADHPLIVGLGSYTERSVNGGLHIVVRGRPPEGFTTPPGVEVYPRTGNRGLILTERVVDGRDRIQERTTVLAERFPARAAPPRPAVAPPHLDLDDTAVIERTLRMAKGRRLHQDGDGSDYPSPSEADLALLCCYISAGAIGEEQLDRLYRSSTWGRSRTKWEDRPDYRALTLARALDGSVVPYVPAPVDVTLVRSSKIGMVVGKPQDAGHHSASDPEPLAATGTDGLPDDIPSLKQIIRDLTRRVEVAERRTIAAEARADMIGRVQRKTASIIKNKHLGQERFTAIALSHRFAHLESTGALTENALHPITLKSVAEVAGISEDAASRHIKTMANAGILRKELRWIPPSVDPETGEITTGHTRQFIGPASGDVITFVDAVANLKPEKPKTWGGRQDRCQPCPDHPHARIIKRVTFHCEECGALLGDPIDEPIETAPPDPHLAGHQDDSPRAARVKRSVDTTLIPLTARFSHNGADSRDRVWVVPAIPRERKRHGQCIETGCDAEAGVGRYCVPHGGGAPLDPWTDGAWGEAEA